LEGEALEDSVVPAPFDMISVPAGVFRTFENLDAHAGHMLAIFDHGGDPHTGIVVPPEASKSSTAAGSLGRAGRPVSEHPAYRQARTAGPHSGAPARAATASRAPCGCAHKVHREAVVGNGQRRIDHGQFQPVAVMARQPLGHQHRHVGGRDHERRGHEMLAQHADRAFEHRPVCRSRSWSG
jgi:hypothetical protein